LEALAPGDSDAEGVALVLPETVFEPVGDPLPVPLRLSELVGVRVEVSLRLVVVVAEGEFDEVLLGDGVPLAEPPAESVVVGVGEPVRELDGVSELLAAGVVDPLAAPDALAPLGTDELEPLREGVCVGDPEVVSLADVVPVGVPDGLCVSVLVGVALMALAVLEADAPSESEGVDERVRVVVSLDVAEGDAAPLSDCEAAGGSGEPVGEGVEVALAAGVTDAVCDALGSGVALRLVEDDALGVGDADAPSDGVWLAVPVPDTVVEGVGVSVVLSD